MRTVFLVPVTALLASLAACGLSDSYVPPVSNAPGSAQGMPQPPGSLPSGAVVNAPLPPASGDLLTVGGARGY